MEENEQLMNTFFSNEHNQLFLKKEWQIYPLEI
jgi:hypothetical protein